MAQVQALPISIQIYSMRNIGNLDQELDTVAAAGYRNVELIGAHLDDAVNVRAKLDARGLKASSSHVSLDALRTRFDTVAAACKTLGFTQLFMPAVPPAERDADGPYWSALGRELGDYARRFAEQGIDLGYHNHHWELKQKEGGKNALELLFEGAAGSPLTWQADVAWLVRGGVDPKVWLKRYSDRVVSVHAKDIAPEGQALDEDGWADVGTGVLDWHDLADASRAAGARWFVAEHDKPSDPGRFARASFTFLNSL
ncbi:sugar phosphate isomerase/epimerase family protein [Pararobbsia silviterrae]|nr:sugar phosphate isomerase/epimerase [Pararobbsia silviterrae]